MKKLKAKVINMGDFMQPAPGMGRIRASLGANFRFARRLEREVEAYIRRKTGLAPAASSGGNRDKP